MADFRAQIDEIKALFSSVNKALAYSKLLQLQEISAVDSSAVETLAGSSSTILSSVVADISCNDEEIAAQALKCLGFMIYHPAVVALIGGCDADLLVESLVKVITTTKIKSVCNLGVWCISIQQLSSSMLDRHFHSLLRAVTHALDNPIGSLSITFEAMQAVAKLVSSLTERMRDTSSLWIPPIYRRLVSLDKRDRDMSERCLLKIMPLIFPPPVTLSKTLAMDMKKKLLSAMNEMLGQGMKIQCLQAWRWFIRLLGPYALKNKHLVNEMLKILKLTFSDFDSQVQIASLVTWEGLVDALIEPGVQALRSSEYNNIEGEAEAERHLKRVKLIMAPLIGIMSSKCDASVHASCLSTWSYLLQKLEDSVNCQTLIRTVWEPIIEVVFQAGPDNKNIWLWNFCLDHLDSLVFGINQGTSGNLHKKEPLQLPHKSSINGQMSVENCQLRHYPIKCSPWKLSQLEFFIKIISIIVDRESNASVAPEFRILASNAAQRLFGSLLETVQRAFRCVSITYDDVMQSINTIFRFLEKMCDNMTSEDDSNYYGPPTCLKFIKMVTERLEPSILESPLYKVALEIKCITKLELATEIRCGSVSDICFRDLEDRVLPVVCLSIHYFSVVVNTPSKAPGYESVFKHMQGYMKLLLSSYKPQEVLHALVCLLYKNIMLNSLQIWVVLASCLKDFIDGKKDLSLLKMETDNIGYSILLRLLSYPLTALSLSDVNFELQNVIEAWELLYVAVDKASQCLHSPAKSFSVDLCTILNGCIDQIASVDNRNKLKENKCSAEFVLLYGNIMICVMKQLAWSISSKGRHYMDSEGRKFSFMSWMLLAARFMKLFWMNKQRTGPSLVSVASRFLEELVKFVGCVHQKEDVLIFVETISSPLLEWLSEMHLLDESSNYQLQVLWSQMVKGLQQSQPSIQFDSSFLSFQQPLLQRALDHPNPAISEATIDFWNSTYGIQSKLDFPKSLVPVLDKLSRNGKIKICGRNQYTEDCISSLDRYKVTNTLKKCSKRVEILGNPVQGSKDLDNIHLGAKRKRPELTEHQKEVRRAQQGRAKDSNGHGPGIRTYTTVDFSQGNEESQDSQRW
ncbi:hypothetical protein C2S53_002900 [Perilla frutescens var. hirtella]|uniref:Telomere-associated protein Rif1 N-terminal domain-containing protein n=1 Tax=Perilla frutescens var. hirtella TaxID=608512 RepID=A0AAD4J0F8_PERFH|nr:hypothetical protein C2S53_002900 [Perilla frutescens var. hirtella]